MANPFAIDHPLGASMLVRAEVAEATKGFDENYHMYCEEIDWSWRVKAAGWKIYTVPTAEIVHYGGESTRQVPARSLVNCGAVGHSSINSITAVSNSPSPANWSCVAWPAKPPRPMTPNSNAPTKRSSKSGKMDMNRLKDKPPGCKLLGASESGQVGI
ncbi:MAG: hypothetical protein HC804_04215 [Anaerolineae bacterium]|nr:hypothetical protein [Anaerolineae bacterium]